MKLTSKGKRTVERVAELALPPGGNIWVKVSALVFLSTQRQSKRAVI